MKQYSYQSKQFDQLLRQLQAEKITGTLHVKSQINSDNPVLCHILVWENGGIIYGDSQISSPQQIAKKQLLKLNPKIAEAAFNVAMTKISSNSSLREFFLLLTKIKAFKWEQIEASIQSQVASIIEQISLYPGTANLDNSLDFKLCFGEDEHSLNWSSLNQELQERRNKWEAFFPEIPAMNAIPQVNADKLATIPKVSIRQHIQKYVNGQDSLIAIATKLDKDPLNIARTYYSWVESGWISFENNSFSNLNQDKSVTSSSKVDKSAEPKNNLPTILSVDDSLIVQASIKRALKDNYKVLLSNNAVDALKMLNKNKIDLLLLDLTMPDIDGLEMCRTLRSIPKFKHLPIVMVTARDTLVDKMKGQIAGTNYYLTKPFDHEQLQAVINKFIGTKNNYKLTA